MKKRQWLLSIVFAFGLSTSFAKTVVTPMPMANQIIMINDVVDLPLSAPLASDWNPYVSNATILPNPFVGTYPLTPVEFNGLATASFKFGNLGSDQLDNLGPGKETILVITFSYGVPYNPAAVDQFNPTQAEALAVVDGTAESYFDWSYDPGTKTFTATQKAGVPIPGNLIDATIIIPYKVTINSSISNQQNGFNVNLTPPGYTGGFNSTDDDKTSTYIHVEAKDFGDAPASYGSVSHFINVYKDPSQTYYENYMFLGASVDPESTDQTSANADGDDNNGTDDENGVVFPALTRGVNVNIPVNVTIVDGDLSLAFGRLNAWIDWNGDGDFSDLGERIATNIFVDNGTLGGNSGTVLINVTVPIDATTSPTFARFRFGNAATSPTNIPLTNWGEVEDYKITILCVAPTATITSQTNISCFGGSNGAIDLSVSGATAPYTYLWSPGGATTQDISGLTAGTYTVTVTEAGGCKTTASATITQPTAISANAVATPSTCSNANGSINLSVSGGTPIYTYAWSNGATTEDISNVLAGNYAVTITDANGCKIISGAAVTNINGPTATITSQSNVLCNGSATGSINLTVTGGTPAYTYLWSNGATTEDLSGLVANTYTVTVTDANLCKSTASTTITQPTAISANAVASPSTCGNANGSVNLTVSGGTPSYSYLWSNGATTEDISGLVANTYTVTVTDANGCTKTASATVNSANGPTATITSQTNVLCNGSATGLINLTVTGGTPAYTYLWSNGATTEDLSGLVANTYTVTVTDANLCKSTASTTITQPTAISASAVASPSTCGNANGSVNLTVSGGTPSYTYLWSNGATTEDISGLVANTYTVTVTDANGCTKTATATVNNANGPIATITSQTNVLCNGSATGSINLTVTGGTPAYTYLWSNGATTEDLSGLVANTYTVTVTDANLCKSTASTTISQPTAISANAVASQSTCGNANGSVNLTVSGGTPSYSYLWSNGATTEDITNVLAGLYNVTVTDANGCTKTASATVSNDNTTCNTDLSITKSGPARVSPGEIITYIITVIVSTDGAAQNVVITDAVPAIIEGVQYSLDGTSGWTNWTGSYNAGTLSAGTSFSIYLRGTVGLLACDLINNSASVTTSTTETNNANNTSNIVSTAVYQPGTNIILANYSFAGAAAYPYNANQTAPGITSSVTSSEPFATSGSGQAPGALAFDNTATAGESLAMQPSTGNNTRYFQFIISGVDLANYSKFKLYLQAQALPEGANLLTFAYSTDGINFFNNGTMSLASPNTWYENIIDWTGVMTLNENTLSSLYIRIYPSGSNAVGSSDATRLEIDNFQVLGLKTVSPVICGPLPATGMELSVNLQNNYTSHLKWYTLSEQNTDHFEVERSLDGRTFTSIKSNIKAAGTSFSRLDYAYDDDISTLASQKVIYYRVKLVDKDGTISYTNIVVVRLNIKEGISVWPNPFTTNLTVSINTSVASHYSMKLMTITGQQLMTKKIKVSPGTNVISLQNLEKYANGTYVLFIENETNSAVHVEKVVKF